MDGRRDQVEVSDLDVLRAPNLHEHAFDMRGYVHDNQPAARLASADAGVDDGCTPDQSMNVSSRRSSTTKRVRRRRSRSVRFSCAAVALSNAPAMRTQPTSTAPLVVKQTNGGTESARPAFESSWGTSISEGLLTLGSHDALPTG
jgi:hypothetical protein